MSGCTSSLGIGPRREEAISIRLRRRDDRWDVIIVSRGADRRRMEEAVASSVSADAALLEARRLAKAKQSPLVVELAVRP